MPLFFPVSEMYLSGGFSTSFPPDYRPLKNRWLHAFPHFYCTLLYSSGSEEVKIQCTLMESISCMANARLVRPVFMEEHKKGRIKKYILYDSRPQKKNSRLLWTKDVFVIFAVSLRKYHTFLYVTGLQTLKGVVGVCCYFFICATDIVLHA